LFADANPADTRDSGAATTDVGGHEHCADPARGDEAAFALNHLPSIAV
jgi:hypothetical protein